jgi:replicative DNA helicase
MADTSKIPALRVIASDAGPVRSPPWNVEIEQALLGAMLVNNGAYERTCDIVEARHFYDPVHGRIYEAIATLIKRGQLADPKTLRGQFENDPALAAVGGAHYLADLAASVITVINAENYAELIRDLYVRREFIKACEDGLNAAYTVNVEQTGAQLIEETEQRFYELANTGELNRGFVAFAKGLDIASEMAERAFRRDSHVTGVTTGLRALDRKLGGLQKSDLVVLAGRPSMGKTALATNIAYKAAQRFHETGGKEGAAVAFFSLEMSVEQLCARVLGEYSGVAADKMRRGEIRNEDFLKFEDVKKYLKAAPIFIDDRASLSVASLCTRARRLKRTMPQLGLIVVDYLQLLQGSKTQQDYKRVQEVSEITRGLKGLAKDLDVPVLALSQLSRAVESREDKRPQLSDLRDSGSIEQDADVVIFVFREEYYHAQREPSAGAGESEASFKSKHQKWLEQGDKIRNLADVIIGKQRHGPVGTVQLHFDGALTRFSDLER